MAIILPCLFPCGAPLAVMSARCRSLNATAGPRAIRWAWGGPPAPQWATATAVEPWAIHPKEGQ